MAYAHNSGEGLSSFWYRLSVMFLVLIALSVCAAAANVGHYKMISTVEYAGDGQFRDQCETFLTVNKDILSDSRAHYAISIKGAGRPMDVAFDIDNGRLMAGVNHDIDFLGAVSNLCAKSIAKVGAGDVGRTWNRSFDISLPGESLVRRLNFTLTAMSQNKEPFGKLIAVRAMSEPFAVDIKNPGGGLNARINTLYLFDSAVEDVYLGISVFESAANAAGRTFRNEVAVYKTDASGKPVDLSGLGGEFESFVGKVGLAGQNLQVSSRTALPEWAKTAGLRNMQAAGICSAIACEGALNPVSSLSIPAACVLEYQTKDNLYVADAKLAAVGSAAAAKASPNIFHQMVSNWGWNLPTAAVVGGVTAGGIAAGGGFGGGGGGSSTPASP